MWLTFVVYLISVANNVAGLLLLTGVACVGVAGLAALYRETMEDFKMKLCGFGLMLVFFSALIPSRDTSYAMLAVYAGNEIVKLEEAKEISGKTYKALNKVLDDFLNEEE